MPSDADMVITGKITDVGKILDIPLLDHLNITSESYHSMADNGQV
jgi:DNA repair protein RadC